MARIYTASPLGLVPDFLGSIENDSRSNNPYNQPGDVKSIFSSKHTILKRNNNRLFSDPLSFGEPSLVHQDTVYDISTTNILKVLDGYPSMRLKSSDFVYTQDYGVYPNNRLIVCRRFPSPVKDDLTSVTIEPSVTLLSWFGEDQSPIEFDFGERWKPTNETLKEVLNDFGRDIGIKAVESAGLGGRLLRLGDAVPHLTGITEVLQRQALEKLGIIGPGGSKLPAGDPNLIMESSRRETVSVENPGSGLTGKIKVKVTCKWEQKFISGVDPTFIYYDILRTILSFGGSNATFYLGASKVASGVDKFLDRLSADPFGLIEDFISNISDALKKLIDNVKKFLTDGNGIKDDNNLGDVSEFLSFNTESIEKVTRSITSFVAYKYKIRIMGIMNYLTGSPSGPWHVTIGNPMRPILSSGDMITQNVTVKLGPTLSFNDLPSTIECNFELESGRNLGIGEIFGKLSCGQVRVTRPNKDYLYSGVTVNGEQVPRSDQPENIQVISSLDDPSFYNSSKNEFERGFLKDQWLGVGSELDAIDQSLPILQSEDNLGDISGTIDQANILETKVGDIGPDSGNSAVRDANDIQNTTEDNQPIQGRNTIEIGGVPYTYEIERGFLGNRIIVKDSSGKSVYTSSYTGPFDVSDSVLIEGAIQKLS